MTSNLGAAALAEAAIKNVIFDVGGVLLEWSPDKILADFYADAHLCAAMKQALFVHEDWRSHNRGEMGEPELLERVAARAQRPPAELSALMDGMRESLAAKPATIDLLRSLRRREIPLYCLSDMPIAVYAYLRKRYDFWDAFRGIVISGEVRLMKPEPEVFKYLLARYQLRAEQSVFIDDLARNAEGARAAGLRAIQFQDAGQCERELALMLA